MPVQSPISLRSQRGAINLPPEQEEYQRLVDALPKEYKHLAKSLWDKGAIQRAAQREKEAREQAMSVSDRSRSRVPPALRRPTTMVLVAAGAIVTLLLLFPPFYVQFAQVTSGMGHAFLFSPPKYGNFLARVDGMALAVEILGVVVLAAIAFLVALQFEKKAI